MEEYSPLLEIACCVQTQGWPETDLASDPLLLSPSAMTWPGRRRRFLMSVLVPCRRDQEWWCYLKKTCLGPSPFYFLCILRVCLVSLVCAKNAGNLFMISSLYIYVLYYFVYSLLQTIALLIIAWGPIKTFLFHTENNLDHRWGKSILS